MIRGRPIAVLGQPSYHRFVRIHLCGVGRLDVLDLDAQLSLADVPAAKQERAVPPGWEMILDGIGSDRYHALMIERATYLVLTWEAYFGPVRKLRTRSFSLVIARQSLGMARKPVRKRHR